MNASPVFTTLITQNNLCAGAWANPWWGRCFPISQRPEELDGFESLEAGVHDYIRYYNQERLTSSPTLAFGHRLRGKVGDSCCATHELPLA